MSKILVSGLVNIETTLRVGAFPIAYNPVHYCFNGIESSVSGVGVNVAKALSTLGKEVVFTTIIGKDMEGDNAIKTIETEKIDSKYMMRTIEKTAQSVILYDKEGTRQINVDLKDLQETDYPEELIDESLNGCSMAILCNINFSRKFLEKAKNRGIKIATDVHCIENVYDSYNADFMKMADILFLSNEKIKGREESFVLEIINRYNNEIIVVGLGKEGALLYVRDDKFWGRFNAVDTRKIVNTIGAGDALFSAFIYFYDKEKNPYEALKKAIVFASWKIGEKGAADGFLKEGEVEVLYREKFCV